jgi:tRNA modification GTPase
VVVNKKDLPLADDYGDLLSTIPHITISAKTGEGILDLESLVLETIFSGKVTTSSEPIASNPRHRDAFRRALHHIGEAQEALTQGLSSDLIAIDVSEAVDALGEITGETASEDLLESIFSRFCIGK